MNISFDQIQIGQEYDRPYLAELWGYKGFQAISRGVITPIGTNHIILFVTKEKQQALTQYNDYINGNNLYWEGEERHSSDNRIINANENGDQIHLFYRDRHHSPFIYFGQVFLQNHQVHTTQPSQFVFSIELEPDSPDLLDDIESHKKEFNSLSNTERESIVKSRVGQGVFREKVITLWGGCSVTGLQTLSLLKASHIKPWRDASNHERLDEMNGLLLHPTLDHLFDSGLITFQDNGEVVISSKLSDKDAKILNINSAARLRKVPDQMKPYLKIHRNSVFKKL